MCSLNFSHRLLGAALAASIGGAALCQAQGKDDPETRQEPAKAKTEVKVGVSLPLSGPLAAYGKCALDGIRMRIEEANAVGGVNGVRVKLVVEDNLGDATAGINAYNKLAGSDGAVAVIGPITSSVALAIRRAAAKLKVPVISPTATNDKVTQGHEYMFRACFNDSFQGRIIAGFVAKETKKAATLVDMNSDYSKGLARSFKDAFTAAGGAVAAEEKYQQKDTDFGAQLKRIKDSGVEMVFVPGYPPELPLIIKQAKAIGLTARLCGADGWDNEAVINGAGDNVENCLLVGAFSQDDQRPVVKKFIAAYQKSASRAPGTFEALGYDSASLLLEAMKGGATPDAIQKSLAGIKDFEAVTGGITIKDGDAIKSAVILKIVKGDDKYVTKYVATVNP
jgi:branched-chain amino acid transport system substrate-binding protein